MGFGTMTGEEALKKMIALHEAYTEQSPNDGGSIGGKETFIAIMYGGFLSASFGLTDDQVMQAINVGRKIHKHLDETGQMEQIECRPDGSRVSKKTGQKVDMITFNECEAGEDLR